MEHRRYQQTEQQYANERLRYYTERLNKGYLQELIPYQNFVTWRYTFDKKKLPINPLTGKPASPTDPATWGTLKEALKRLEVGYTNERTGRREWDHGLGFALGNTPFTAIDVDHTVGTNRTVYYPGKGA